MKQHLLEYINDIGFAACHASTTPMDWNPRVVSGERNSTFIRLSPEERVTRGEDWGQEGRANFDPADIPLIMTTKRFENAKKGASPRSPHLSIGLTRLIWGQWTPSGDVQIGRDVGPAYILLEDHRFYYAGQTAPQGSDKIKVKMAKFYWVRDGNYARHNGPHEVQFSVRMVASGNNMLTPEFGSVEIGWNDGRGRRIPMSALNTALHADDEMEVDPFAVDSSFDGPLDEMAFWSEVKF